MKLGPTQGPRVVSRFIYEVEIMPYSFYNWPTQAMFFFSDMMITIVFSGLLVDLP